MKDIIRKELSEAQSVLENFFIDDNINKIESAANIFKTTISQGNKIISCGNGGSMCDAMHFAILEKSIKTRRSHTRNL